MSKDNLERGVKNLKEKAARGEYDLVAPLDYYILELLPDEGEMFAGLYPMAESVGGVIKGLEKRVGKVPGGIKNTIISARMRILHIQGLVSKATSGVDSHGKSVWQRTKAGKDLVNHWKEGDGVVR